MKIKEGTQKSRTRSKRLNNKIENLICCRQKNKIGMISFYTYFQSLFVGLIRATGLLACPCGPSIQTVSEKKNQTPSTIRKILAICQKIFD